MKVTRPKLIIAAIVLLVLVIIIARGKKTETADAVTTIPVVVETATNGTIVHRININGEIRGQNQADIYPDVPGKIQDLYVSEGQYVGAGQAVAAVDRSQVGQVYMPAVVRAPISGVIGKVYVDKGQTVSPSMPIMLIADTRVVEGVMHVTEKNAQYFRIGQPAEIRTEAYRNNPLQGVVSKVASLIDTRTRTLEIRLSLANTEGKLIPGNYADFSVRVREYPGQIKVPFDAIVDTIDRKEVFVVEETQSPHGGSVVKDNPSVPKTLPAGKKYLVARARTVEIGIQDGDQIQILSGLKAGDRVITLGKENVVDGTQIRVIAKATDGRTNAAGKRD